MENGGIQFGKVELAAILADACRDLYNYYDIQCGLGAGDVPRYIVSGSDSVSARRERRAAPDLSSVRGGEPARGGGRLSEESAVGKRSAVGERSAGGGAGKLLAGVRRLSGSRGFDAYSGLSFSEREAGLLRLRESAAVCRRCFLGSIVGEGSMGRIAGDGRLDAPLFFICSGFEPSELSEGRIPAGASGELMDRILKAIGWMREDVYFANRVCCIPERAPDSRGEQEAVYSCNGYLLEQIGLVRPQVIMCWGQAAYQSLFRRDTRNIQEYAGRWTEFMGISVMPTYHPRYLLQNPKAHRIVWRDVQSVASRLVSLGGDRG